MIAKYEQNQLNKNDSEEKDTQYGKRTHFHLFVLYYYWKSHLIRLIPMGSWHIDYIIFNLLDNFLSKTTIKYNAFNGINDFIHNNFY